MIFNFFFHEKSHIEMAIYSETGPHNMLCTLFRLNSEKFQNFSFQPKFLRKTNLKMITWVNSKICRIHPFYDFWDFSVNGHSDNGFSVTNIKNHVKGEFVISLFEFSLSMIHRLWSIWYGSYSLTHVKAMEGYLFTGLLTLRELKSKWIKVMNMRTSNKRPDNWRYCWKVLFRPRDQTR